jgi:hypothetical protein
MSLTYTFVDCMPCSAALLKTRFFFQRVFWYSVAFIAYRVSTRPGVIAVDPTSRLASLLDFFSLGLQRRKESGRSQPDGRRSRSRIPLIAGAVAATLALEHPLPEVPEYTQVRRICTVGTLFERPAESWGPDLDDLKTLCTRIPPSRLGERLSPFYCADASAIILCSLIVFWTMPVVRVLLFGFKARLFHHATPLDPSHSPRFTSFSWRKPGRWRVSLSVMFKPGHSRPDVRSRHLERTQASQIRRRPKVDYCFVILKCRADGQARQRWR